MLCFGIYQFEFEYFHFLCLISSWCNLVGHRLFIYGKFLYSAVFYDYSKPTIFPVKPRLEDLSHATINARTLFVCKSQSLSIPRYSPTELSELEQRRMDELILDGTRQHRVRARILSMFSPLHHCAPFIGEMCNCDSVYVWVIPGALQSITYLIGKITPSRRTAI